MWPIGGCASVSEPTDEGECEQHDNEDFEKDSHVTVAFLDVQMSAASSLAHHGACNVGEGQTLTSLVEPFNRQMRYHFF